jgi:hypothetical protein
VLGGGGVRGTSWLMGALHGLVAETGGFGAAPRHIHGCCRRRPDREWGQALGRPPARPPGPPQSADGRRNFPRGVQAEEPRPRLASACGESTAGGPGPRDEGPGRRPTRRLCLNRSHHQADARAGAGKLAGAPTPLGRCHRLRHRRTGLRSDGPARPARSLRSPSPHPAPSPASTARRRSGGGGRSTAACTAAPTWTWSQVSRLTSSSASTRSLLLLAPHPPCSGRFARCFTSSSSPRCAPWSGRAPGWS